MSVLNRQQTLARQDTVMESEDEEEEEDVLENIKTKEESLKQRSSVPTNGGDTVLPPTQTGAVSTSSSAIQTDSVQTSPVHTSATYTSTKQNPVTQSSKVEVSEDTEPQQCNSSKDMEERWDGGSQCSEEQSSSALGSDRCNSDGIHSSNVQICSVGDSSPVLNSVTFSDTNESVNTLKSLEREETSRSSSSGSYRYSNT